MRIAGLRRLLFALCEAALLRTCLGLNAVSYALLKAAEQLHERAR